jgi:putative FmdB family regulatory protein
MPTYDFLCEKCRRKFSLMLSIAEFERQTAKRIRCPRCKSVRVSRQISGFQVQTSKKS